MIYASHAQNITWPAVVFAVVLVGATVIVVAIVEWWSKR